jgi:hypothetical protein
LLAQLAREAAMSEKPINSVIQPVGNAIKRVVSAMQPASSTTPPTRTTMGPAVEVSKAGMRINEVWVTRADVVAYINGITPDKREVALVHAIEVGVTEILVRRRRGGGH